MVNQILMGITFCAVLLSLPNVYAESVFENDPSFGAFINLGEIVGEKYSLEIEDKPFTIFYGEGGSFDDMAKQTNPSVISEMFIEQDSKSLNIEFNQVPETQAFWIILPDEVITADKGKFLLMVDNIEKGYELANIKEGYTMAFILPENTQHVKIIGTYVVPEFGVMTAIVFAVSIIGIVLFARKTRFVANGLIKI